MCSSSKRNHQSKSSLCIKTGSNIVRQESSVTFKRIFTSSRWTFLGSRNTLSFCLFVFGFGCPRNSRTWPWTRFELLFKLLTPSKLKIFFTIPRAEKWGTLTTTWVSVISSGSRKCIPFSVQWATDSRPSGSKAVKNNYNTVFTTQPL